MFEKLKTSFKKIAIKKLDDQNLEKVLDDFKIELVRNDVAYQAAEEICDLVKKKELVGKELGRHKSVKKLTRNALKEALTQILTPQIPIDFLKLIEDINNNGSPAILVFLGINGTGKTTTIAKISYFLKKRGKSVVLAAADTFRAGSIEQLDKHAKKLKVKIIKREYGADSASVAFDAVNHAQSQDINVVLIDTAGRMETNRNLMDEVQKICRVSEPDLKIFVASLLVGNDAYLQAETFNKEVGIDASILNMADADIKGGATISVAFTTKKPIIFLGNGQKYGDLMEFTPEKFIDIIFQD